MKEENRLKEGKKIFSWWKVAIPIAIGLTVVVLMMVHEGREQDILGVLGNIRFTWRTAICMGLAFLFIFGRDFGLSWRFRALTNYELTWKQAYKVDLLCEFTSCVTPSAVGGSSLGMVFLNTEGIELGRATTLMMTTLIMDELFFVVVCPIIILFTPANELFSASSGGFGQGIQLTFWIVYAGIFLWTAILFVGVILKPLWIQKMIGKIFRMKWLRKWESAATGLAGDMVATSKVLRGKRFRFWVEIFGGTAVSWMSRYLVVNALFFGFLPTTDPEQWVIFARQFVMWVVLMVSPTPGGAGLSEWIFSEYYGDIITSATMALILAVIWRLVTYYLYLGIGCFLVPSWLKKAYGKFQNFRKANDAVEHISGVEAENKDG